MVRTRLLAALACAVPAVAARACTVCDSRNGHQLRAGLFDGHFLHTILVVGAPMPVFAAVMLLLHFGMPDLQATERQPDAPPLTASETGA